jgi:hypothetical protein
MAKRKAQRSSKPRSAVWSISTGRRANSCSTKPRAFSAWWPVAAYLSSLATGQPMKLATIRRRLATIGYAHRCAKHDSPADDPAVKATMAGIARTIGSVRTKKTALTAALVTKVVKAISAETLASGGGARRLAQCGADHRRPIVSHRARGKVSKARISLRTVSRMIKRRCAAVATSRRPTPSGIMPARKSCS